MTVTYSVLFRNDYDKLTCKHDELFDQSKQNAKYGVGVKSAMHVRLQRERYCFCEHFMNSSTCYFIFEKYMFCVCISSFK